MKRIMFSLLAIGLLPNAASALEAKVERTMNADAKTAWTAVGDFCHIQSWHPAVTKCEISQKDGKTFRTLFLDGGGELYEELKNFDKAGMSYTYTIVRGPLPVANYTSTLSVTPDGDKAKLTWVGNFDAKDASDEDAVKTMTGVYAGGLDSLVKAK